MRCVLECSDTRHFEACLFLNFHAFVFFCVFIFVASASLLLFPLCGRILRKRDAIPSRGRKNQYDIETTEM
jgi:hypothetical protein